MYSDPSQAPTAFKAAEQHYRSPQWQQGLRTFPETGRYVFPERPGLVLLKGYLTVQQQEELVNEALTEYLQPPYRTNLGDPRPSLYTSDLMSKVTWSTMGTCHPGFQYNWTDKSYPEAWRTPLPPSILHYSSLISSSEGFSITPQAVIVNFYHPKMRLGGHKDDIEPNLSVPLISIR